MPLAHANDESRMTRLQLADRLRGMLATQSREALEAREGNPRRNRPGERILRAEKIKRYQAELDRRTAADAEDAAADARQIAAAAIITEARIERDHGPAAAAGYRSITAELAAQASTDARKMYRTCANEDCHAQAISTDDPPLCARHGAAAAAARHAEQKEQPMNTYDAAEQSHRNCPTESQWSNSENQQRDQHSDRAAKRRAEDDAEAATKGYRSIRPARECPIIPAPPDQALTVECPQCNAAPAERCHNYKGDNCHPHGKRNALARQRAAVTRAQADSPTPAAAPIPQPRTPDARAAKHAAKEATAHRRATVAAARDASRQTFVGPRNWYTPERWFELTGKRDQDTRTA